MKKPLLNVAGLLLVVGFLIISLMRGQAQISAQHNRFNFDYFGQEPPDTILKEFKIPSNINQGYNFINSISFSPSGDIIAFGLTDSIWSTSKIVYTYKKGGHWSLLDTISACKNGINANPAFFSDSILYFTSWRDGQKDLDIYKAFKIAGYWEPAEMVKELSIDTCREFMGSFSCNGEIYFTRLQNLKTPHRDSVMNNDIFTAKYNNGGFFDVKNIGSPINTKYSEVCPFIDPYGKYLLFGARKEDGSGLVDTYISFRDEKGGWNDPLHIKEINSNEIDADAVVTPDGKYLFFIRRQDFTCTVPNKIYWISAKILEKYNY